MSSRRTILLTGCGGAPAQNVCWALQHTGDRYRLIGAEADPYKLPLTEGFDRRYRVPRADDPSYIDVLNQIIEREHVDLVHSQPDVEVSVISARRDDLRARVFLPDAAIVELCHDKFALKQRLGPAGIGTARGVRIEADTDLEAVIADLGPKVWIRAIRGAAGRGALLVERADHARFWVDYWNGFGNFMAEEYLPGRNLAWQGVYHQGELVGSIAWERLQYVIPSVAPSGITGTPAVARIIDEDEVHDIGRRTVAAVDPQPNGIYGVDMKGAADGTPFVTEINPGRFFQPSFIYTRAGYPLQQLYFAMVFGDPRPELPVRASLPAELHWIRGLDNHPVLRAFDRLPEVGEAL